MKAAMEAGGILKSGRVRPPTEVPNAAELAAIAAAVEIAGLGGRKAA
jgi:dihydrodipicolinate synthase/N-acetylneuraminate lyase